MTVYELGERIPPGCVSHGPVTARDCRQGDHGDSRESTRDRVLERRQGTADPQSILNTHMSHGIGDSPMDSPLIRDPVGAAMIVRAATCATATTLQRLHGDDAEGARLVERLRADGLVADRDGRTCTTFPILTGERQVRYASLTDEAAGDAFQRLSPDFAAVLRAVRERGWTDWEYHFLWSQLFDSQFAWTDMMTRKLVPPLDRVIAWVVFPEHRFRSGTNYYPDTELRDYWLPVTWRSGAANTTGPLGDAWESIYRAGAGGDPLTDAERARLGELGVIDQRGQFQWPLLRREDPLLDMLQEVARRYVDFLAHQLPLEELVQLAGVDERHAFAMAYHDVSWGILERFDRTGGLGVPPALAPGSRDAQPSMRGVAALTPVYRPFADLIREAIAAQ